MGTAKENIKNQYKLEDWKILLKFLKKKKKQNSQKKQA